MIRIRISADAVADLNDGHWFYEAQETGLGDYFTSCLRADIEGLKVSAGIHRIVYRDYRRLLSRVFPYGIFYTWTTKAQWFGLLSICDAIRSGFVIT
jgi:hypothetical protein